MFVFFTCVSNLSTDYDWSMQMKFSKEKLRPHCPWLSNCKWWGRKAIWAYWKREAWITLNRENITDPSEKNFPAVTIFGIKLLLVVSNCFIHLFIILVLFSKMKKLLTQLFCSLLINPFRTVNNSKLINSVLWSYINKKNKSNNSNGFYKL